MSRNTARISDLRKNAAKGYWGDRIVSQLEYADSVSKWGNCACDALIEKTLDFIEEQFRVTGSIIPETVKKAESMLSEISGAAKSYDVICTAHAHIDMNWLWRFDETVAVTLDTFRTMLDLMDEFPDFKFSQSQASVYRIVEEYDPEMLGEIKKRVAEGRWEVTASTWVEHDKNTPDGESHARHLLYTKRYLSGLLDIDPDSLDIDFEPDTFGHSINVPEILYRAGIRYYYHCRGNERNGLYVWKAPSGSSVLVYKEPIWYNSDITPSEFRHVPELCSVNGMKTMLKVYGVGDHGGGPTRRDIERIMDMNTWPIFPRFRFGTFRDFFRKAEEVRDRVPVVEGEQNFIFTGCYSSQSRIKAGNRVCELFMNEVEVFDAVSALCTGFRHSRESFFRAWENIMFNHFHDIITGSGIADTRDYAMGLYQRTMALAGSIKKKALAKVASGIDTTGLIPETDINVQGTVSEGAGVGYGMTGTNISQVERGRGKTRVFHLFNPAPFDRNEIVEVTAWDWTWDINRIVFRDAEGNVLEHQLLSSGNDSYWGHSYVKSLVRVSVPACGYTTITMSEDNCQEAKYDPRPIPRVENPAQYVMENEYIRVVFDTRDASIVSFTDKNTGAELIGNGKKSGFFRYIEEDTVKGMTAWYVGRYMNVTDLLKNVRITDYRRSNLRQSLSYIINFGKSSMKVTVSLDDNRPALRYDVSVDWLETGSRDTCIPQLNFHLPVSYRCSEYKYDVPFGVIKRPETDMNVPACSFVLGCPASGRGGLMIVTSGKYGFRGWQDSMSVTLVRSSYDPDPYPELGRHSFTFYVLVADNDSNRELVDISYVLSHPVTVVTGERQEGTLPPAKSFIKLEKGNVALSAVKLPETDCCGQKKPGATELVVRLYETEGSETNAVLKLCAPVESAEITDITEKPAQTCGVVAEGDTVSVEMKPFTVCTLKIRLEAHAAGCNEK